MASTPFAIPEGMRRGKKLLVMVGLLHVVLLVPSSLSLLGECSTFCDGYVSGFCPQHPTKTCSRTNIQRRVRERRADQADPRILTSKISGAKTAAELLALVAKNVDSRNFNEFHISVVFSRLARFKKFDKLGPDDRQIKLVWPRLITRLRSMMKRGVLDAQAVSNAVYAVAELHSDLGHGKEMDGLLPELVKSLEAKSVEMKPQGLSNCLWAAARLRSEAPILQKAIPVLARSIVDNKMDRLVAQDLANNLWAAAYLQEDSPEILAVVPYLAERLPGEVHNMGPQGLSNSLWAAARLHVAAPAVLNVVSHLASQVQSEVSRMNCQHLSNCLWAAAKLQDAAPEVLEAVPSLSLRIPYKTQNMDLQSLSNCLWAAAKLQQAAPDILKAVSPLALAWQKPENSDAAIPQQLSNSLWAAAKLHEAVPEVWAMVPVLVAKTHLKFKEETLEGLQMSCWAAEQLGEHDLHTKLKAELVRRKW